MWRQPTHEPAGTGQAAARPGPATPVVRTCRHDCGPKVLTQACGTAAAATPVHTGRGGPRRPPTGAPPGPCASASAAAAARGAGGPAAGRFFISAGGAAENRGEGAALITTRCPRLARPRRVLATVTGGRHRVATGLVPAPWRCPVRVCKAWWVAGDPVRAAPPFAVAGLTSKRLPAASAPGRGSSFLQGKTLLAKTAGHSVGAVPCGSPSLRLPPPLANHRLLDDEAWMRVYVP